MQNQQKLYFMHTKNFGIALMKDTKGAICPFVTPIKALTQLNQPFLQRIHPCSTDCALANLFKNDDGTYIYQTRCT